MFMRSPYCKIKVADKLYFETGDGYLQSCSVEIAEQERASSCSFSFHDPGLKVLNLLLTEFQRVGGIYVPANLLEEPQEAIASATSEGGTTLGANYLQNLEKRFGCGSDLTKLTPTGKRCLEALKSVNVQAFLKAVAIAELGEEAEAKGGYGYLFGDTGGKETYSPCSLATHPDKVVKYSGGGSSATGRYQTLNTVWRDDAYGKDKLGLADFKPVSQEILAVGRLIYRQILDDIIAGNFEQAIQGRGLVKGAYTGARYEWASLEGNPYGQGTTGGKRGTFLANIKKFQQTVASTAIAAKNEPEVANQAEKVKTPALPIGIAAPGTGISPSAIASTDSIESGVLLTIELGFQDKTSEAGAYQYILTDVRGSNDFPNVTRIQGKQLAYAIAKGSRVKRENTYKVHQNTTVRQLAIAFAKKSGGSVKEIETDSAANNVFSIFQADSDYETLLKAAKSQGLFVRSEATKLKIEPLKPDDRTFTLKAIALKTGATWGDSATSERVIISSDINAKEEKPKEGEKKDAAATGGILDLKLKPGEEVGKGFECNVSVNTMMLPEILTAQPGNILKLDADIGFGDAIARSYRIGSVSHGYQNNVITTSLNLYLPVKIKPKAKAVEPGTSGKATSTSSTLFIPANLQATPKRGDAIAGFTVSSPYGPRSSPGGVGSTDHKGVDVPMPVGTPLYPILKAGETVDVTYKPNYGSAGNLAEFTSGGFIHQYMHLSEGSSGKYKAGDIVARSGNTGASTGPHLHYTQRKLDRTPIPPQAGFLYWAIAGKEPK